MRPFKIFLLCLVGFILFFFLTYSFWFTQMARFLSVSDHLEKADAILVLGGGVGDRVFEATRLYKEGLAPCIVMCGGPLLGQHNLADLMKEEAQSLGISGNAVLMVREGSSTLGNATFSLPLIKRNGFKKIIVVTSPYHTRRTKMVFQKVYHGKNIKIMVHGVTSNPFSVYSQNDWWQQHEGIDVVVREWMSLVFYFFRGYI
ncbi:MAG: YdcF family protein [Candidatus Saganbacteria bacterium]|nr:YdcF family protein [Candidatus Saganbacteria bacterium]